MSSIQCLNMRSLPCWHGDSRVPGRGAPGEYFLYCADSTVTTARAHDRGKGLGFSASLDSTFFCAGKIVSDLQVIC